MVGEKADKLPFVEHVSLERDYMVKRKVVSIYGMPFYQSSGLNSDFHNTWFPFHGLNENGVFIKRSYEDEQFPLPQAFREIFLPLSCYDRSTANLGARFGSLAGLLISSCLGDGLWDTNRGKALKRILLKNYNEFYKVWPLLVLDDCANETTTTNRNLNHWLLSLAGRNEVRDLCYIFPKNLKTLIEIPLHSCQIQVQELPVLCDVADHQFDEEQVEPKMRKSCVIF